jgi:hypothetical protein
MVPTTTRTTVKTYRFTITLAGAPTPDAGLDDAAWSDRMAELLDELTGRALAAGLDDATLGSCGEVFTLDFDREAESLGDAIGSAVKDIERAGFTVDRVDVDGPKG